MLSVVDVSIAGVEAGNEDLGLVPAECVAWCSAQPYEATVLDDMASVDLDWWNQRLAERSVPVRLHGRNHDGARTDHGVATIARADLITAAARGGLGELHVLYTAAAWLSGHRDRARLRRFLDVRTGSQSGHELDKITAALTVCRQQHLQSIPHIASDLQWSGWPRTPGVGPIVLSLYCWAAHHDDSAERAAVRPHLLDQQAVASLIHLGWAHNPVVAKFTWKHYTRYCELLHLWSIQAGVAAELIEMWLVARWRERAAHRASHADPNAWY